MSNNYFDTIEVDGLSFAVSMEGDDYMSPPWEECDGHGPVSEWTRYGKAPGELVLVEDHGCKRYYDYQEACRIARRDGWGNFQGTPRQRAALAARADYERLRAWCQDEWSYVVLTVELLDDDGDKTGITESLGGVESDGWNEYAVELALQIVWSAQRMAA